MGRGELYLLSEFLSWSFDGKDALIKGSNYFRFLKGGVFFFAMRDNILKKDFRPKRYQILLVSLLLVYLNS